MSEKLAASLRDGLHGELKSLVGNWKGITKVWYEPGVLADTSPCEGTMRSILDGKFLLHEYKGSLEGKPIEGLAIYGYSIGDQKLQCAWVDSFHNGTAIMFSENIEIKSPYSVLGGYGAEPRWGWRTEINRNSENQITISMYNIPPGGKEDLAVETVYTRVK